MRAAVRSAIAAMVLVLGAPAQALSPLQSTSIALAQPASGTASGRSPLWVAKYASPYSSKSQTSTDSESYALGVASDPSAGRVFVTGASQGSAMGEMDMATIAYDVSTGSKLWIDRYGVAEQGAVATGTAIAADPSRNRVYAVGASPRHHGVWVTIAYRASTGHRLWLRQLTGAMGSADQIPAALQVSPDGKTVYVAGGIDRAGGGLEFGVVAYRSSTGRKLWTATYHGLHTSRDDAVASLALDPHGDRLYVTGPSRGHGSSVNKQFHTSYPNIDFATLSFDAHTGRRLWVARYNDRSNGGDFPVGVTVSPDGSHVYVDGSAGTSIDKPSSIAAIAYRTKSGHREWIQRYRRPDTETAATAILISPNGRRVYVAGQIMHADPYTVCQAGSSDCDFLTVAYRASSGRRLWAKRHGISGDDVEVINGLVTSPDSRTVYVSGASGSPEKGVADYVTIAYRAVSGRQRWLATYNSAPDSSDSDVQTGSTLSRDGNRLFLTGTFRSCDSTDPLATNCVSSYGTIAYRP